MLGKVLNERYKILKELGQGGMALVYEAQDLLLDRKVAVKMLRPEYVSDKEFIKKFRHEAKAVARISHPNVVSIFDIGQDDEYHYLVMENIKGRNLKKIIEERGKLSVIEALDIANQVCAALVLAHRNNIIHCDIKPHNILINSDKQVKVTDFGIARAVTTSTTVTMTDTIIGSAHYFSPEQARGGEIKAYSDLYSIGVVLYEMLSGKVPFTGDSPVSVALKHIQKEPDKLRNLNSSIPEEVEKLVMKSLAKKPEERFESAANMRQAITGVLQNLHSQKDNNSTIVLSDSNTKIIKRSALKGKQEKDVNQKNREQKEKKYLTETKKVQRKNKWLKWLLIVFGFIAISIVALMFVYQNYMEVPVVEVPDVVGLKFEEAKSVSAQVGLELQKQNEGVYNSKIPKNNIISQSPVAGERVRQTRVITVAVSKGPLIIEVPDLIGKSLRKVEIMLDNKNIKLGKKTYRYHEDILKDYIIAQEPEPGKEIKAEDKVDLVVSKGPQPVMVKVPDLIGLLREKAISQLEENNLRVGNISKEKSKRFKSGQVTKQQYTSGKKVPQDTGVNFTVSEGLINKENAEVYTSSVGVNVIGKQEIKIIVIDNNGKDIVYQAVHNQGDYISQTINSVGPTIFRVYIDEELAKEERIGY